MARAGKAAKPAYTGVWRLAPTLLYTLNVERAYLLMLAGAVGFALLVMGLSLSLPGVP